ncbi:MAG TPA: MBL fold metallo-hydrolase [Solirubrobacteraceae bacterium]|nr:MBL fold metallo-hydrolase [Solirubrobacteraceae bacterium]
MRVRWLGWAGVEIEEGGEHIVVDPLKDAAAVFAWLGDRAAAMPRPEVIAPRAGALAGLLTHLHRDHADAAALAASLSGDASVYEPQGYGGSRTEQLAIAQADQELTAAELSRTPTAPWTSRTIGPFTVTALPAVDGTGDPQVSWLIEAGGQRALHLGDTMFHGWWWRITGRFGAPNVVLAPINGARVAFPHRQPASSLAAVMDPEQAALAAKLLGAEQLVPIHYDGYALPGIYEPAPDALNRLKSTSNRVTTLHLGESIEI